MRIIDVSKTVLRTYSMALDECRPKNKEQSTLNQQQLNYNMIVGNIIA